jgi:HlyD family secretion protein
MNQARQRRYLLWTTALLAAAAILVYALLPTPLAVDTGRAARGALQVTIAEEGETRARDRFILSAPVTGRLMRVTAKAGDPVKRGEIVARIDPLPLTQRERQEALARVDAAQAALQRAIAREAHAREDAGLASRERERAEKLAQDGVISTQLLDQARNADITARQESDAARHDVDFASSELNVARAALVGFDAAASQRGPLIELRSPVTGSVLRVVEESERVLQAGNPIIILGEPNRLEIVTDVLSTDAVQVPPGAAVLVDGWGGDHSLRARVRRVEPAGFTKVSALGVEEQRVNVISDFVDSQEALGDGYRVQTRIVIWETANCLKVPLSALFRDGTEWAVFVVENGRARKRLVEAGHRTELEVEVVKGLSEGETVILHPSNEVRDGVRLRTS